MKKYRIVEFMNGTYGIQCKNSLFSFWKFLPIEPLSYVNGARSHIVELRTRDQEEITRKKNLKIKSVVI